MVNTNIQSAISLKGPGARYRMGGNYAPGEFRAFQNVTVTPNGSIRSRRMYRGFKIGPYGAKVGFISPTFGYPLSGDNKYKLDAPTVAVLGELETYPVSIIGDVQYLMDFPGGEGSMRALWAPTSLPANEYLVGVFTYNNKNYWLTGGYGVAYNLYSQATQGGSTDLIVQNATYANISASKVSIVTPDVAGKFRNFFMHKERLWITTSTGIYFSAATDPTKFAIVDGGGFVKLQGKVINHAFALGDSVYISTDRSVEVFTYSSDPNEDGYVRNISSQKAVWGTVLNSIPYIISNQALYTVANGTLDKIVDINDVNSETYNLTKIRPLGGDSLILFTSKNLYAWVFDTVTGSLHYHSIDGDRQDDPNLSTYTNPYASTPIEAANFYDSSTMQYDPMTYLLLIKQVTGASNQWAVSAYYMNHVWAESDSADDLCILFNSTALDWRPIKIALKMLNISPDGFKYMFKKFRMLEFEATIPYNNFRVRVAFDDSDFSEHYWNGVSGPARSNLTEDTNSSDNNIAPYTFRVPLNQRAKSMSIRFETYDSTKANSYSYQNFELMDARYFWSYTNRVGNKMNNTAPPA